MSDQRGYDPDDDRPKDPTEGVRIIDDDEAAEAIERGDVAPRRSDDEPRYGDRPAAPPAGPRPALRFPLDASADPSRVERPPVQPPPDPVTGPVELPHWTEPPTGEVPQVLINEDPALGGGDDDLDAWSSFATSAPRWRDADDGWADDDFVESLRDDSPMGALQDPEDQLSHDEYLTFGDLEERVEERRGGAFTGSDDDGYDDEEQWAQAHEGDPAWADQPATTAADDGWSASGGYRDDGVDDEVGYDDDGYGDDWAASSERDAPAAAGAPGGVGTRRRRTSVPHAQDAGDGPRDIQTAVIAGGVMGVIAIVALLIDAWAMMLLATVVIVLAAVEYFNVIRRAGFETAVLVGLVSCTAFPLAVYWRGTLGYTVVIAGAIIVCLLWYLVGAGGEHPRVVEGTGVTMMGVLWIGALGAFASLMLRGPQGRSVLLSAILATVAYDVAGLFIGRGTGHTPLSAASPNKTREGLVGGMVGALVVTLIVVAGAGLGPWDSWGAALVLGLAAAVAAPLGDLCQSLVKRDLGIKDMGTLIPGHGGVLDRVDALLFVLPAFYLLVSLVGHKL